MGTPLVLLLLGRRTDDDRQEQNASVPRAHLPHATREEGRDAVASAVRRRHPPRRSGRRARCRRQTAASATEEVAGVPAPVPGGGGVQAGSRRMCAAPPRCRRLSHGGRAQLLQREMWLPPARSIRRVQPERADRGEDERARRAGRERMSSSAQTAWSSPARPALSSSSLACCSRSARWEWELSSRRDNTIGVGESYGCCFCLSTVSYLKGSVVLESRKLWA